MANPNDKPDVGGTDWDSMLDQIERPTSPPPDPDQKTPPAPKAAAAPPRAPKAPPARQEEATRPELPTSEAKTVPPPPAPAPKPAHRSYEEEDERTVVGQIPQELLADSVRGGGGLGHLMKRAAAAAPAPAPAPPPVPDVAMDIDIDASSIEDDMSDIEDEPSVVTSAPLIRPKADAPRPPPPKAAPKPEVRDDLDPFADLRPPAPAPAQTPAPPAAPPRPASKSAPDKAPKPPPLAAAEKTPKPPKVPEPPPPRDPMATPPGELEHDAAPAAPAGRASISDEVPKGPKLLEPQKRVYPEEERTGVFNLSQLPGGADADADTSIDGTDISDAEAAEIAALEADVGTIDQRELDEVTNVPSGSYEIADEAEEIETQAPPVAPTPPAPRATPTPTGVAARAQQPAPPKPRQPARSEAKTKPLSLPPPPLPSPEAQRWPDERDASVQLSEAGVIDEWVERATWLEAEARLQDDPIIRSRILVAVSELLAMTGDEERAHALAVEARELNPDCALAHRAERANAIRAKDFLAVAPLLEQEHKTTKHSIARAHAAVLEAEIARLVSGDATLSTTRMGDAIKAEPGDPRAHVSRLVPLVATAIQPPSYKWPDAPELAPLAEAVATLAAARGASEKGAPPKSVHDSLARARKALAGSDTSSAAEALADIASLRGVGEGALWLTTALAAPRASTRARAVDALKGLNGGSLATQASRLGALLALEQGDAAAALGALDTSDAFNDAERVAIGALLGAPAESLATWLASVAADGALAPLSSAVESTLAPTTAPSVGEAASQARVGLGRALAGTAEESASRASAAIESLESQAPGSAVPWVLRLEANHRAGEASHVAAAVGTWARQESSSELERDRALASSLLFEIAGQTERAVAAATQAQEAEPASEVAARVLVSLKPNDAATPLITLAGATGDPTRRALLLLEAAQHASEDERAELLRQAHEAAPDLPFASLIALGYAQRTGDHEALHNWLKVRRESSADPIEAAFEQIREARQATNDPDLAHSLLEQASQARPEEAPLRDALERVRPSTAVDLAWLETRAEKAEGFDKARWAFVAARERFRAGDVESASKLAKVAIDAGAGDLARLARDAADIFGAGASRLTEELMEAAKATEDPVAQREIYERLAYLDEVGRNDPSGALLWHRAILERSPNNLASLRKFEQTLISDARDDEMEPIFAEIARATVGPEASAHAQVATRLRLRNATWDATSDLVELAVGADSPPGLWGLRQQYSLARHRGDDAVLRRTSLQLAERTELPLEVATLSVRTAEAAARIGDLEASASLLRGVLDLVPEHAVAHNSLAEVLELSGDLAGAANALEAAAKASAVAAHQCQLFYDAALIWLDRLNDRVKGQAALEEVAERDMLFASDVFRRLQTMYIETGERVKLASLLERRLEREDDPVQRVELEVTRGRALAEVGDTEGAKLALEAALASNPDHVGALQASINLCIQLEHWEDAERSLLNLARLSPEPPRQAAIYFQLGDLYEKHLDDADRAEQAFHEVLKRDAERVDAREHLIAIYAAKGDAARSIEMQTALLANAKDPVEKRTRTIEMARLYETVGNDLKKAETTLETLRKEFPHEASVLRAMAEFHLRHDHAPAANVLLDRATADARRALGTGRFDLNFFANLATVFELRKRDDAAAVARGTLSVLEGGTSSIEGVGMRAARGDLDDLLAPEVLTPQFRVLLNRAGEALDAASPVEPKVLKATPPPDSAADFVDQTMRLASVFGFPQLTILVSPTLGTVCMPVSSKPAVLIYGAALVAEPRAEIREFLTIRALKILQARVAAFARTAPIDLWPMAAAFLKTLAPSWNPTGVDAKKFAEFQMRIKNAIPKDLPNDTQSIATEVVGSLGNRASTLQTSANSFGARCALLASGDIQTALLAIACASGHQQGPPASGPERLTWITRNAEARDAVVFSVSDPYFEARNR
ncbi:MAG: hypothetical protein U0165_00205 [Polyangiaceae bacterium]